MAHIGVFRMTLCGFSLTVRNQSTGFTRRSEFTLNQEKRG